jgi:hypothetical protein
MVLILLCVTLLLGTAAVAAQDKAGSFVLDPSKPYVYLKFDHIGKREPLSRDEVDKGLWLQLVNNSRIPIIVAVFNPGTSDPGIGIFDEIIPLTVKGPFLQGLRPGETPSKPSKPPRLNPPEGYDAEVFSTATISPNDSLLFSVPLNHVSSSWHLQIKFYLDVPGGGYGSEPYSAVSFHWQDIPEKVRADLHP